jgi:ATP-dependent Clp protease adaptor protein ClpS
MSHNEQYNEELSSLLESEGNYESFLILHNDDVNTFDHVIDCLVEICHHDSHQAEQCAYIVHYNGRCDVKKGGYEELSLMKDKLISRGLSATVDN